jgi:hypothetical protein
MICHHDPIFHQVGKLIECHLRIDRYLDSNDRREHMLDELFGTYHCHSHSIHQHGKSLGD